MFHSESTHQGVQGARKRGPLWGLEPLSRFAAAPGSQPGHGWRQAPAADEHIMMCQRRVSVQRASVAPEVDSSTTGLLVDMAQLGGASRTAISVLVAEGTLTFRLHGSEYPHRGGISARSTLLLRAQKSAAGRALTRVFWPLQLAAVWGCLDNPAPDGRRALQKWALW